MKSLRVVPVWLVVCCMNTSALAGDLQSSMATAASQLAQQQETKAPETSIPKAYLWPGAALFAGGLTFAFYNFLYNGSGSRGSEEHLGGLWGSNHTHLGAAGLGVALVGGTLLFAGKQKATHAPTLMFGPGGVAVSKQVTW